MTWQTNALFVLAFLLFMGCGASGIVWLLHGRLLLTSTELFVGLGNAWLGLFLGAQLGMKMHKGGNDA